MDYQVGLTVLSCVIATAISVPLGILIVESIAALLARRPAKAIPFAARGRCAVLVPAHNEESSIGRTVQGILAQLRPEDRVLVVADNCVDTTAHEARTAGAAVIERQDPLHKGKGFALDYGMRFLESDPPDFVLLIDADCTLGEGAIDALLGEAARSQSPVQGAYVMGLPAGAGVRDQISSLAFQYKNVIRPLGLTCLRLPCLLTGTGMAFPWALLRDAPLASGNIVEDMQLGLDLAVAGHPPRFCSQAQVRSELPVGQGPATTQRKRWEHGHLRTLLGQVPRLLAASWRQRRLDLLGLAMELSVPPLSMLFLIWATAVVGSIGLGWLLGIWLPALILIVSGLAAQGVLLAAWFKFGRTTLPFSSLLAAPFYALGKLPIYATFFLRPQQTWVRTARTTHSTGNQGV